MQRILVLGRGGAGKSTAARRLGHITGLPVVELDREFWRPGLVATPPEEWVREQARLGAAERWVMDGDLGPYDVLPPRLERADTVLVLDFSLVRCAWQALRRSSERIAFWLWVLAWRHRSRPALLASIAVHAPDAALHVARTPRRLQHLLLLAALQARSSGSPRELGDPLLRHTHDVRDGGLGQPRGRTGPDEFGT